MIKREIAMHRKNIKTKPPVKRRKIEKPVMAIVASEPSSEVDIYGDDVSVLIDTEIARAQTEKAAVEAAPAPAEVKTTDPTVSTELATKYAGIKRARTPEQDVVQPAEEPPLPLTDEQFAFVQ